MNRLDFYRSSRWVDLCKIIKSERTQEDGLIYCEYCGKPIVKAYDCIGHHKTELTDDNYMDANISLNSENIMVVHHRCHNQIHCRFGHEHVGIYLVYGSPCSGKTTFVHDNMQNGDLIIDMDSIWQCVSGCERYTKPNKLRSCVFSVRDTLIEMIEHRQGKWGSAWLIGGYPFQNERERICNRLGAKEIYIESTKQECMQRLSDDKNRNFETWSKYIEDWWNEHTLPIVK